MQFIVQFNDLGSFKLLGDVPLRLVIEESFSFFLSYTN